MAYTDEQYKAIAKFIEANLGNPSLGISLEDITKDFISNLYAPTISGKGVDVSGESGLRSMYGPYVQDILSRASGLLALRDDPNFQERKFGTTYGASTFKDLEDLQKQRKSMMGMGDDKSSMYTPYNYSFANMPATAKTQGRQTTKPAAKGGLMSLIDSYADGGTVGQTVPSTFTPPIGGYQQATYTPGSMNYTAPGTYQAGTIGSTFDQTKAGAYTGPAAGKEIASTFTTPANIYSAGAIGSTYQGTAPYAGSNIQSTYQTPGDIYKASQVTSGYQAPAAYQAGTFAPEKATAEEFGRAQVEKYMSPFTSEVVDPQLREARRQAEITRQAQAARMAKAGAFGGSRQAIMESELNRNLATQLGDIYGTGQQKAFENAQTQFERDQARQAAAQQLNIQKGLEAQQLSEQSKQFGAGLTARSAELAAQLGLQAQTATEAARQAAGAQSLTSAQTAAQLGLEAQKAKEQAAQFGAGLTSQEAQTRAQLALQGQTAQEAARQAAGQQALTAAQTAGQLGLEAQKAKEQAAQFGAGLTSQEAQTKAQLALQGQTAQEAARQAAGAQALSAAQTAGQLGLQAQTAQEAAKQAAGQQALTAAQTAGQLGLQAQTAQEAARQAAGQQAISAAQIAAQLGLQGSQLSEQSRQFAANYGLQSAQTAAQYDQAARQLQQQAEEAQARGDQFAANLALQQLQEAQRAAEATRGFEYQQARDQYLDPYRELGYAQQLLSGLPITAGAAGDSASLQALLAGLGLSGIVKPGT